MEKNPREIYLFHQTPEKLCKILLNYVPYVEGDVLLEPFKGEGGFYNNFPTSTTNEWCELEEGRCYTSYEGKADWVISNPPFRLELEKGKKRINAFYLLLDYWLKRTNKGVCFLANYNCWNSLTPKRLDEIKKQGFCLNKIVVCNVKKWAGRYYFLIFSKIGLVMPIPFLDYIVGSY